MTAPSEFETTLYTTLHHLADLLAACPPDVLAARQPRPNSRNRPAARRTKREVVLDGLIAAADLLYAQRQTVDPDPNSGLGATVEG